MDLTSSFASRQEYWKYVLLLAGDFILGHHHMRIPRKKITPIFQSRHLSPNAEKQDLPPSVSLLQLHGLSGEGGRLWPTDSSQLISHTPGATSSILVYGRARTLNQNKATKFAEPHTKPRGRGRPDQRS